MSVTCSKTLLRVCTKQHVTQTCRFKSHNPKVPWSSSEIRKQFIDFFCNRDHLFVQSSSVLPLKGEGTYFTNAGMNQFKPIFLGTALPDSPLSHYIRVANSQKCIRVGGKHNDLDAVGKDHSHHTFFEMLGSWSFGDYFKEKSCALALELLTDVYEIPVQRLYFTYFGGNDALNLPPDLECKEIWLALGVPPDHILPFGSMDNFWDMGETGPCGPCTEIHYDHIEGRNASRLVNTGAPDVVEIWNIVFMQYNRQADQSLQTLSTNHVDTGMGLERMTAALTGTMSNYDTDVFQPLFHKIQKLTGCRMYSGLFGRYDVDGLDTAYRIVADHARMFTVTIGDGLLPSRADLGFKLRQVMHRSIHQARVLGGSPGSLTSLVETVVDTLGNAFPELKVNLHKIQNIVYQTEENYAKTSEQGRKVVQKLMDKAKTKHLSGNNLFDLTVGKFGVSLSPDMISFIAHELRITTDLAEYQRIHDEYMIKERQAQAADQKLKESTNLSPVISQSDRDLLHSCGILATDDTCKYQYSQDAKRKYVFTTPQYCEILKLLHDGTFVDHVTSGDQCGVLMNKTHFYSESGGQSADTGFIQTEKGKLNVTDVQTFGGYVLHTGEVVEGSLSVGQSANPSINQDHRERNMRNHTATHLLNFVLKERFEDSKQMGSRIDADKFTFNFSCLTNVSDDDIIHVESAVRELIERGLPVHKCVMQFENAKQIHKLIFLDNMIYPATVNVVSVGKTVDDLKVHKKSTSVELCGGTHVSNTQDIAAFCITKLTGVAQGTKQVTCITGLAAEEALLNSEAADSLLTDLEKMVREKKRLEEWRERVRELRKILALDVLPKVPRLQMQQRVDRLGEPMKIQLNAVRKEALKKTITHLLNDNQDNRQVSVSPLEDEDMKLVVPVLAKCRLRKWLIFYSTWNKKTKIVIAAPEVLQSPVSSAICVGEKLCNLFHGKGKLNKNLSIYTMEIKSELSSETIQNHVEEIICNSISKQDICQ